MGVDCRLCVRDGKKERKRVSECERVRMRACVCVRAQVSECMSTCVSLFHSYVNSESEYRHKSDGPLSSIRSRNVQSSA